MAESHSRLPGGVRRGSGQVGKSGGVLRRNYSVDFFGGEMGEVGEN